MKSCCAVFISYVEDGKFMYYPVWRSYCCYVKDEEHYGPNGYGQCILEYCPFCGTKLPKNLYAVDEYYDALEEVVGKEFCDIKEEEIPDEFQTDEWWKKRGL